MEFDDVIVSRKSIRAYKSQKIDDELINYVLNCARLAPSWANRQSWHFIVVKNKDIILRLSKTSLINRWLKDAPVIIVACGDPDRSGKNNGIPYFIVDVSIAMEHLVLAAASKGLGTCWIAGFNEKKVKEILEIPENIRVIALTPLGYPLGKKKLFGEMVKIVIRSNKRKNIDEIVHLEKW